MKADRAVLAGILALGSATWVAIGILLGAHAVVWTAVVSAWVLLGAFGALTDDR